MNDDESFPELEAFEAQQRTRHARMAAMLGGGGALLIAAGVIILVVSERTQSKIITAGMLIAIGLFAAGRAALSWFTDVDTKDRGEFDDEPQVREFDDE